MKKWLKYLFVFYILIFSTGIAMAQGPYSFSNSWSNTISYTSPGWPGGTSVYHSITLTQGDELKHLDYSVSWKDQGSADPPGTNPGGAWANLKIELYDNSNIHVQTLETIYDYTVVNNGYYTYTGSLNFNIPIQAGYKVQIEITAKSQNWSSFVNAATITAVTGPLCETLIFEDDFQTSPISPEWSTTSGVLPALFSYNSTQVFGPFYNKTIELYLSGLPATHSHIRVEFDLYIFDSWDGNGDDWKLKVDGVDRIDTDFDNHTWFSAPINMQAYPHNIEFNNPTQTGAVQTGLPNRCWDGNLYTGSTNCTSKYLINNITQHTSNFLTIGLQALGLSGWQAICDESWGIDNVKVYALGIHGCTDPLATNYDPNAVCDDGSCIIYGCIDILACNYNSSANTDDASCVFDVSIPVVTNTCPGLSDGMISVSVSPIDPNVISYTYTIDAGASTAYNDTTFSLSATNYAYEFFIDGISCGAESITINEFPAMTLQTTVVDSTCDSSYAFVNVSVSQIVVDTIADVTPYCLSAPNASGFICQIDSVYLSGDNNIINNSIPLSTIVSYSDNTNYYADLSPGQSYSIDVHLNSFYGSIVNAGAKIYIDWNMNGDFTDPLEQIGMISNLPFPNDSSITINVPSNATPGATVMRIISQYNEDLGIETCSNTDYVYGETQDYTIVVNSQTSAVGLTYLWSPSGGTNDTTTSLAVDTYTVTVTDTNGCEATETAIVLASAPISVTADTNQTICNGYAPSSLNASSGGVAGTYSWTDSLGNVLETGSNFAPGPLSTTTTYTVTFTDANGCTATDSVIINVLAELDIDSLIASPNPACEGDIIIIEAFPNNPLYEYKFKYRDASTSWGNITSYGGWLSTNNIQYGPILQDTDFRVIIRNASDGSCITNWLPSYQGITVPVNPLPSSGPIYHN